MRVWTEKERKRQACIARRNRPWKNSTGPKTAAGKYRSSRNACKAGVYMAELRALCRETGFPLKAMRELLVLSFKIHLEEERTEKERRNEVKRNDGKTTG